MAEKCRSIEKTKLELVELLDKGQHLINAAEYALFLKISLDALYVRNARKELAPPLPNLGRSLRWTPQSIASFHSEKQDPR